MNIIFLFIRYFLCCAQISYVSWVVVVLIFIYIYCSALSEENILIG